MYHKNNPWARLVALLLMALILVFTCTGCTKANAETAPRFTTKEIFRDWRSGDNARIITDTETGRQYLIYGNQYLNGMVELED